MFTRETGADHGRGGVTDSSGAKGLACTVGSIKDRHGVVARSRSHWYPPAEEVRIGTVLAPNDGRVVS